ncbi:bola protein, partial [Dimargaris cristalligena]
PGPVELQIREKLTARFQPTELEVENQSHLHAHHEAMRGVTNSETHFKVTIVAEYFRHLKPLQRHRAVYSLLQPELDAGLHALSLQTKAP